MEHREFIDYIEAAYKLRQYLSAFLMQSAYIESVINIYLSFQIVDNIDKKDTKFYKTLSLRFEKMGLRDALKFLKESGALTEDHFKTLDKYREKRNRIVHNLVIQMISDSSFEESLKKEYDSVHTTIVVSEWFKEVVDSIEAVEKKMKIRVDPKK